MIEQVSSGTISQAAEIYSIAWKGSHKNICSPDFLAKHTPEYSKAYLKREIAKGIRLYMLTTEKPVGIISVHYSLIENLYVLPDEQNKGYGTQLLRFAISLCPEAPTLWMLNTNISAQRLYERNGFRLTGNRVDHTDTICDLELRLY